MSGKVCVRCGVEAYGLVRNEDDIHVCADIKRRHERRQRQVEAIMPFLERYEVESVKRRVAELIVAKLVQMGVTEDA